jgi:hypothetical protein
MRHRHDVLTAEQGAISRVQEQIWRLRDSIPFIHSLSWRFSSCVDATRLTWTVGSSRWTRPIPSRNIFWMCPWCRYADTELGDLLCSFIQAAAAIQGEGDMLLLGLAVESYWGPCYHLEDVEAAAREHGYLVLPRDRRFVEEALRYGYVHHTLSPRGAEDKLHGPLFWQLKVHPFLKRSAYAVSLGAELPFATMDSESWEELVQVAEVGTLRGGPCLIADPSPGPAPCGGGTRGHLGGYCMRVRR